MSENTAVVENFVVAQRALLMGAVGSENLFGRSAVTAFESLRDGAKLQQLADANRENFEAGKRLGIGKGLLYVSVQGVAMHAQAGSILCLPVAEGEIAPVPTKVQALIVKATRKGVKVPTIKAAARRATQQEAIAYLTDALDKVLTAATEAPTPTAETETGETGEGEGGNVTSIESVQTVESLLGRALAMVQNGTELTDAARALLAEIAGTEIAAAA